MPFLGVWEACACSVHTCGWKGSESQAISLEAVMDISSGTERLTDLRTWNLGLTPEQLKAETRKDLRPEA